MEDREKIFSEDEATRHSMSKLHCGRQSKEEEIFYNQAGGKLESLAQALKSGALNFSDIFTEVRKIAISDRDASVRLKANELLKKWLDDAKKEVDGHDMPERDVVDLLATALAKIPRNKYIEVLRICRLQRYKLIRERNKKIDVEGIIRDEQTKRSWTDTSTTDTGELSRINSAVRNSKVAKPSDMLDDSDSAVF